MIRPIEDIALARITQAEEEERRRQAIQRAAAVAPWPAFLWLLQANGVTQRHIATVIGGTWQNVQYHRRAFEKVLKGAYNDAD